MLEQKHRLKAVVDAVWFGMSDPRTGAVPPEVCLPMCVLFQRVVSALGLPERFHLRLGALTVFPTEPAHHRLGPKVYDPRDSDDTSSGFHAWLETDTGFRVDASILITLRALGYRVDDEDFLAFTGTLVEHRGLQFLYEHLPDLEVIGVEESESALAQQLRKALVGQEFTSPATIHLDIRWRR